MDNQTMTKEQFTKRLGELCLRSGSSGFPKSMTDQHVLLKSVILTLGSSGSYSEKEINDKLEYWVRDLCQIKEIDRVSLRRRLVDTGYLNRSKDGSSYQVAQPGPHPEMFAADIEGLDIAQVIESARAEIARRKSEYLNKKEPK